MLRRVMTSILGWTHNMFGSIRMIPLTDGIWLIWEYNENLEMSEEDQLAHNKRVDPSFETRKFVPNPIKITLE